MILIITDTDDLSAIDVEDWIKYFGEECIIVNANSKIELSSIDFSNNKIILLIEGIKFDLKDLKSIWYRKMPFQIIRFPINCRKNKPIEFRINEYMKLENDVVNEYINYIIAKTKKTLCANDKLYVNKLLQLEKAQEVGLKIPDTRIFTSKSEIKKYSRNRHLITKGIFEAFLYVDCYNECSSSTELVRSSCITSNPISSFAPSLFQEKVKKLFEIRVFYLNGTFYSMAIFSQSNDKTKIDFRHYDLEKPNRMVPYKLPFLIEKKLNKFMKEINLNTGSIDLIFTINCEYYFLEVNPVGQFGFLSGLSNYNLEKKIAKYLCGK